MAKKTAREYWTKRAVQDDQRRTSQLDVAADHLDKAFEHAETVIHLRLEKFYRKFAADNKMTVSQARKRLAAAERADLQRALGKWMTEATTEDDKRAIAWLKARRYVTRQEALLADIRHQVSRLHVEKERIFQDSGIQILKNEELHQLYNIENLIGCKLDFQRLSDAQLQTLLHHGYDGTDYSSKIWYDKNVLVAALNRVIPQGFILGWGPDKQAAEIAKSMNAAKNNALRLVRTEGSFLAAQADVSVFSGAGVETYEFFATLDTRTSTMCRAMDGRHFPVAEAEAGVNLPPLHPNCRSTTLPDVDMSDYTEMRLARDKHGGYIRIDTMTYAQWNKKYAG